MGKSVLLEVCVTWAGQAARAAAAGADRLELCAALDLDGLTPPREVFREAFAVGLPVCVLVRPRAGDFVYTSDEWAAILRDAEWFLANGATAIVGGALSGSGELDRIRCGDLVRVCDGRAVLHRAFDRVADQATALEQAIDLGFRRVLTSGGKPTAPTGAATLRELVRRAAGRIEILPGGGIRAENVAPLVRETGCDQVHGSFGGADPKVLVRVRLELDRL